MCERGVLPDVSRTITTDMSCEDKDPQLKELTPGACDKADAYASELTLAASDLLTMGDQDSCVEVGKQLANIQSYSRSLRAAAEIRFGLACKCSYYREKFYELKDELYLPASLDKLSEERQTALKEKLQATLDSLAVIEAEFE